MILIEAKVATGMDDLEVLFHSKIHLFIDAPRHFVFCCIQLLSHVFPPDRVSEVQYLHRSGRRQVGGL